MTLGETISVSLTTAVATASLTVLVQFVGAHFQRQNERVKHHREKLLERYSEFAAFASVELDRAKTVEAIIMTTGKDNDFSFAVKFLEQRNALRIDLLRVSLQIRLLENESDLAEMVKKLAASQPFIYSPFPPHWGQGNFDDRLERYQQEVRDFEKQVMGLVDAVLEKHSVRTLGLKTLFGK